MHTGNVFMDNSVYHPGDSGTRTQENMYPNNSIGLRQAPLLLTPQPFVYNNGNEFFPHQVCVIEDGEI